MHRSQVFIYSLYVFIASIAVASLVDIDDQWLGYMIVIGVIILAICAYKKTFPDTPRGNTHREFGFLVGFLFFISVIGVARLNYFTERVSAFDEFIDVRVGDKDVGFNFLGYIDSHPEISNGKQRFIFKVKGVKGSGQMIDVNERILVTTNILPEYRFGQYFVLNGALKYPQNFDDFDYITYLKKDRIRALMPFPSIQSVEPFGIGFFENIKIKILSRIFSVRDSFQAAINRSITEPNASYINGILLGIRQNIPEDLTVAFEKTSTTHILAISGYNITIIANSLLLALIYFFKRRTAFWVSVAVIIIFTIMVGASASVVRASIVGLLLLFANGFGRLYDIKNSILFAGSAMIALNPMSLVFDIGFQLSFLAVIGLVYFYPILDRKIKKIPQWNGIREVALMTLSAQILVLPLLIYYFNNFSIVSLPANVIVLPFVPAAMLFGFLSGLFGIFSVWLGWGFGIIAWSISLFQLEAIKYFANLPFSSLIISVHPITLIAVYLLIFAAMRRGNKSKPVTEDTALSSIKNL